MTLFPPPPKIIHIHLLNSSFICCERTWSVKYWCHLSGTCGVDGGGYFHAINFLKSSGPFKIPCLGSPGVKYWSFRITGVVRVLEEDPDFAFKSHCSEYDYAMMKWVPDQHFKQYSSQICYVLVHHNLSNMGISRDSFHKRRATGGRVKPLTKKRKHCLGRPMAHTKLGQKRIHTVRVRGGNIKHRAMRLDAGNYSWGSESISRKTRWGRTSLCRGVWSCRTLFSIQAEETLSLKNS